MTWHADHRGWGGLVAALLVVAGVFMATWSTRGADAPAEVRVVVLVVRDMSFYVDGQPARNPVLRFAPGEAVRVIVRSEEPGFKHDFAIPDWQVATPQLDGVGSGAVTFTVPARPGRYEYRCNPHAAMMRGVIEVN